MGKRDLVNVELIIHHDEYQAISDELRDLKIERRQLNYKLNNDSEFRDSFDSRNAFRVWEDTARARLGVIKERVEYLKTLANVYNAGMHKAMVDSGVYERRKQSRNGLAKPGGITDLLRRARIAIEQLHEMSGDQWTEDHSMTCSDLRLLEDRTAGDPELGGWVTPSTARAMQSRHDEEVNSIRSRHRAELLEAQRTIGDLQAGLDQIRLRRGVAIRLLERLCNNAHPELEDWRLRLGYTHHIYLTGADYADLTECVTRG